MIIEIEEIEPIMGPDIPLLPCIYQEECLDWDEYCPYDCPDYLWREPKWQ